MILSPFDKQLCEYLQVGMAVVERPFASLAEQLSSDEDKVLFRLRMLLKEGVIRRIGPDLNPLALGQTVTQVASHVPGHQLHYVADRLAEVNHVSELCLRDHHYNVWFSLQGREFTQIEQTLTDLGAHCSVGFHCLPALRTFKQQRYLDLTGQCRDSLGNVPASAATVTLSSEEKRLLKDLEGHCELEPDFFNQWVTPERSLAAVLSLIQGLQDRGVVQSMAALLDPRQLGFHAQALWVCRIPERSLEDVGRYVAEQHGVSTCQQRQAFADWHYNLYTTLQARRADEIHQIIQDVIEHFGIRVHETLPMIQAFHKGPVHYDLN